MIIEEIGFNPQSHGQRRRQRKAALVSRPSHLTFPFLQLVYNCLSPIACMTKCCKTTLETVSMPYILQNTPYHMYIFCSKLISKDILKWLNLWDYCFHKVGEVLRDVSDDRRTSRARVMGDNFRQTAVRGVRWWWLACAAEFFSKCILTRNQYTLKQTI